MHVNVDSYRRKVLVRNFGQWLKADRRLDLLDKNYVHSIVVRAFLSLFIKPWPIECVAICSLS